MSWIQNSDLIVLLAGAIFTLGYLTIHQVALRLLMLIGTVLYIYYYATVSATPLWSAIYVSLTMGVANLIGMAWLYLRQTALVIPRAHRDLYDRFSDFTPGDFRELMRFATRRKVEEAEQLTSERHPVTCLTFVLSGQLSLEKAGECFDLPGGYFVGEIGYLTGQNASASTWINPGAELLQWDTATLQRQSARNARFKLVLEALISKDLAAKVAGSVGRQNFDWKGSGRQGDPDQPRPI